MSNTPQSLIYTLELRQVVLKNWYYATEAYGKQRKIEKKSNNSFFF
jgi:hypothetical protein